MLTYLGRYDLVVDIFDNETIWTAFGRDVGFLEGYQLGIRKKEGKTIIALVDSYKTQVLEFPVIERTNGKSYDGLIFDFKEISIDYKSLIAEVVKGDLTIPQSKLTNYTEELMVKSFKESVRYSSHARRIITMAKQGQL